MLTITIPETEEWDSSREMFIVRKSITVQLEHSLLSLAKWEAHWCKPYLNGKPKTEEEILYYLKCMCIKKPEDDDWVYRLTIQNRNEVADYIESKMTSLVFRDEKQKGGSSETITNELIYYWMIAYNIPFECEKWHLNKLLALIKLCNIKNGGGKKMSKQELYARNRSLNEKRKAARHTRG